MNTVTLDSMTLDNFEMADSQLLSTVEAGDGVDSILSGVATYGAATMGICAVSGSICWGLGVAYLLTCAAAGGMIGYGAATNIR
ncbi:bacteriocin-type signal sequence [Streptococcus dentapri]|uniref:Bacteriocin-type signal sequence n=1 Tax=Streptococcus dentapri TaxID=573564 RepID=A0ABV8D350_9STRE